MALLTPLAKVRGLGAAKEGAHHWWMQRITAAALVPLVAWLVCAVVHMALGGHEEVIRWFSSPYTAIAMLLFFVAACYHAALGLQVIIEDYVHCKCVEVVSIIGIKLFFFTVAVAMLFAVAKLHFIGA